MSPSPITPWGRGRLLAALTTVIVLTTAVLGGLGLLIVNTLGTSATSPHDTAAPAAPSAEQRRNAIAAAPMRPTRAAEARPGASPATTPAAPFAVPAPTTDGPAGVPSGFPATAAGAVGQLAAIQVAVLHRMSIDTTADVHRGWVASGGPTLEEWRVAGAVRSFLAGAGMGPVKDRGTYLDVRPVAAQLKGSDGPTWVVACVLLDVRAVVVSEARTAYGVCERMEWDGTRWLVAPGPQPAPAPSTWPGTTAAVEAGWLTWHQSDGTLR